MRKLMISSLTACLCIAISSVALAQTRPSQVPQNGRVNRGGFRQDVLRWTSQNMPNLAKLASNFTPDRNAFFGDAASRFRAYQNARDDKAKQKVLTSCKQEDEIFGYVLELQQAAEDDKPAILEKIKLATQSFVKGILLERKSHIDSLKKQILEEEHKLADDWNNFDQLVDSRVNSRFLKEDSTTRPEKGNDTPTNSSQPPAGGALTSPEKP